MDKELADYARSRMANEIPLERKKWLGETGFPLGGTNELVDYSFLQPTRSLGTVKNPLHTALLRLRRKMYHVDYTAYVY